MNELTRDLVDFLEEVPWVFTDSNKINLLKEKTFECSQEFEAAFPALTNLLKKASIIEFNYGSKNFELFGWINADSESFGWLCVKPEAVNRFDKQLHPDHFLLLEYFGGIIERWNEPEDTWLVNLNSAFTYEDAASGFNGNEELLYESCQQDKVEMEIEPEDFNSFAFEANGNVTMYHNQTGKVLMYASDHFFDFITPYKNYPEYTLYQITNCRTFKEWVETVSIQWINHLER